nr:MAG TPA: hypothetical protein [Crassvirales sp.]DAG93461.1 MAG TPA: hypothetical protein [Crassvirales sp.]DAR45795.1 MAG TPA: hypothetical protein [Bacteriophage sp.]DAU06285.1 MAG TPA: hypothetical protein [Caudoviricetes sp.]DAX21729.1 MAG TPA: hypothetical protein [Caudoviricetes sp.]
MQKEFQSSRSRFNQFTYCDYFCLAQLVIEKRYRDK